VKILALFDELGFRSIRGRARAVLAPGSLGDGSEDEDGSGGDGSDANGKNGAAEEEQEDIPAEDLGEAKILLWLLASDFTNPSLDDIFAYTKAQTFADAHAMLRARVAETGKLLEVFESIEKPLMPILRKMETHGVLIDRAALAELQKTYRAELTVCEAKIYRLAGREFLISSPKQLGDVLFDDLGLRPPKGAGTQKKTATGQRSTRESELEKIREEHPIVDCILEYRQIQKLLSTYIESIPLLLADDNRLHAEFLQEGTTTGRMASQNPNLQNIPIRSERGRAIRDSFIAPPDFTLLALDYSQIELRLAAILSADPILCEIFASGRDVHTEVAARVFNVSAEQVDREMRRRAKVINFGILYGMGVNALKAQLGTSTAEAHQFSEDYFNTFKRLAAYLEEVRGFARKHGHTETMFGRRREFSGIKSTLPYVRAQAERMAINAPIQGTEADLIKLAMVRVDAMLAEMNAEEDVYLLLQVHDELVYEIRDTRLAELTPRIKEIMEAVLSEFDTHNVPITVEAKSGMNWGDMAPL
jgi:DNA polymerase-1